MRTLFKMVALAAVLPLALLGSPSEANAVSVDIIGGVVQGTGSISPGLVLGLTSGPPPVLNPQTFSFNGIITLRYPPGTFAPANVAANGTDLIGWVELGEGPVNLNVPYSCPGTFVRVDAVVVAVFANLSVSPGTVTVCGGGGVFAFLPDQTPPATVTSYSLIGIGGAAAA